MYKVIFATFLIIQTGKTLLTWSRANYRAPGWTWHVCRSAMVKPSAWKDLQRCHWSCTVERHSEGFMFFSPTKKNCLSQLFLRWSLLLVSWHFPLFFFRKMVVCCFATGFSFPRLQEVVISKHCAVIWKRWDAFPLILMENPSIEFLQLNKQVE